MSKFITFALLATFALTGCYRMPTDEEYSLVPSTNNRDATRQRDEGPLPKLSY